MQSKIAFKNIVLKSLVMSQNHAGLRCLQFLCIIVFYEIISFAFIEKYDGLVERTAEITKNLLAANMVAIRLSSDVKLLRTKIFIDVHSVHMMDYGSRAFQIKYGYVPFAKYIVRFCGMSGPMAEKSSSGTSNKRKFKEDDGGYRNDSKALESLCEELKQEKAKVSKFPL